MAACVSGDRTLGPPVTHETFKRVNECHGGMRERDRERARDTW
jgi:hypothetical protein